MSRTPDEESGGGQGAHGSWRRQKSSKREAAFTLVECPQVKATPSPSREIHIQAGTRFSFTLPSDTISGHRGPRGDSPYGVAIVFLMACADHVEYAPPPAGAGLEATPFGCFDAGGGRLGPDDFVFSYTTVFSFANRTNQNPVLDHLVFGGAPVAPAAGVSVARCAEQTLDSCPTMTLDTIVPGSSQEIDPGNTDVQGTILREQIWVDYLLTAGKMDKDVAILFDPHTGRLSATEDKLFAPQSAGDYLLWAVVRDNRCGADWLQVPLHVR